MAEISEDELEDILKDLPAHEIYSELNQNYKNEPKFSSHCGKMYKFKHKNNEMVKLCKKIAWNLEKLSYIPSKETRDVRCSYFNHWIYNEIWKLVGTESNYKIDREAILKLVDIGFGINKELSGPYCSYEYYNNRDFSKWMEMKNLHDYFKNFDQIKKKIRSAGDKYEIYIKYLNYISKIYVNFEDECCDSELEEFEFKPIYFKCGEEYHPQNLLSLLERNNSTSGDQTRVKSLKELNTQEDVSDDITLENDNAGDVSGTKKLNQLKKDEFQTSNQPLITVGEDSQNSALSSIQNPVNDSCQYVDRLQDNSGIMNCRSQETSKASEQEYLKEKIEQVSGSLQADTVQIKDVRKSREDTEESIAGRVTSLPLQGDRHSEPRRNANGVHESRFSSIAVENGHTLFSNQGSGNVYTDSSDTREEERNSLEFLGSHFSSILDILKKNLSSISIVSSASIGLIILLLVYFKFMRRKTGLRRKREEMNNNYYTYGEEGIPELLGYSQNFAYSNPDNRQIPIFYSYA
ncbi:PIR protein [Plasmodium vivax]|nr:PIR protein [Plasmodium vivax]